MGQFEQWNFDATHSPLAQRRWPRIVADIMTEGPMTIEPQQSFAQAVTLMANQSFRHVLVVDHERRLHGVISDRDVLRALARTSDWNSKTVSEIMTADPVTTTRDAPISRALKAMLEKRINSLPVVDDDGRVCGILTSTDLLKAYDALQSTLEQL